MYVQSQKPSRKNYWKPPLDTNFSFRDVAHKYISARATQPQTIRRDGFWILDGSFSFAKV